MTADGRRVYFSTHSPLMPGSVGAPPRPQTLQVGDSACLVCGSHEPAFGSESDVDRIWCSRSWSGAIGINIADQSPLCAGGDLPGPSAAAERGAAGPRRPRPAAAVQVRRLGLSSRLAARLS